MSVPDKIKSVMMLKKRKSKDLAEYLGISPQAMRNKFARGSFSAEDLIKISKFLDVEFAFVVDENVKIVFDETDLRKSESRSE